MADYSREPTIPFTGLRGSLLTGPGLRTTPPVCRQHEEYCGNPDAARIARSYAFRVEDPQPDVQPWYKVVKKPALVGAAIGLILLLALVLGLLGGLGVLGGDYGHNQDGGDQRSVSSTNTCCNATAMSSPTEPVFTSTITIGATTFTSTSVHTTTTTTTTTTAFDDLVGSLRLTWARSAPTTSLTSSSWVTGPTVTLTSVSTTTSSFKTVVTTHSSMSSLPERTSTVAAIPHATSCPSPDTFATSVSLVTVAGAVDGWSQHFPGGSSAAACCSSCFGGAGSGYGGCVAWVYLPGNKFTPCILLSYENGTTAGQDAQCPRGYAGAVHHADDGSQIAGPGPCALDGWDEA